MLTKVAKVECLGGFRLRFTFNDGSVGDHDFSGMVAGSGSLLQPLKDPAYFSRVFLEFGAPTWPNGFDMSPEWVRRTLADAKELRRLTPAQ
jgi:hypothetical protein